MRNLTAIRIDPVDYDGKYGITDVEFAYLDVVIPFRFINRFNLSNRDAILEGAVAFLIQRFFVCSLCCSIHKSTWVRVLGEPEL